MKNYKIAVAGTGYVGLSLGVLFAQHHQVVAVDIVQAKVDMINNKKSPIQDDYIEKYLAEKDLDLTATLDAKAAYSDADFVVIAAPTNYDSHTQHFDTSAVEAVIKLVMEYNPNAIMVIKSTIPVGYTASVREKFNSKNIIFSPEFLREYGDEAACVAVNEQGKLVAEDLWNGFDEDFQDAVKEYFAEKNPTSQKEELVVPVEEESRTDDSDVPVYYESFGYAAENGEVDLYRISRQLNEECRNAIEEAIADNFDGMNLADDATKSVVEQFGMERMGYILAYTLNYNNHDGRYSHSNKEWADTTCKGERGNNIRPDWIVRSHPAVLNGFVDMYRKELEAEQQREPEKPFVQQFYVVTDLQTNPMQIEKFGDLDDAMSCYQQVPNFHLKALGVEKTPDPLPGSLDIVQCKNGIDTIVEDYKKVPGWDNPYIQNHVVALVAEALKVQDVAVAYEINDGYFHIQTSEDGYDYTLYSKDFTVMDGGIVETDEYRPVQEVMEEVLAEHGHSVSECGVISAEYLQEQFYRAETQRAEAMKEKLVAEKPAPEASISFYVAECAEFPVMGEFHDNLTLEQALEVYDKIPAERMKGIKSIGFSLEDGSIYSGMFDLMVGGEVQAEVVNHIQHYRESPLVQKAISDMKTLLEKRQASKELEERPSTRQSVREALKNRKKAQEQQSNQEQEKPKKAKKKGEMEL